MDCSDLHKFMHAYLDGEFAEEDRVLFAVHLKTCEACRLAVQSQVSFKQRLREAVELTPAPTRLRAQVAGVLRTMPGGGTAAWYKRWLLPVIPAAAVVLLVVGGVVARSNTLSNLAEQSVEWHRTQVPMDVTVSMDMTGPRDEPIRRFFSDKVPFAVKLPGFGVSDAKLVGARLSSLGGRQAVYLNYLVRGQRVSVFIVDPRALPSGERLIESANPISWYGVRGYNVAVFSSGGTGYAVASDMDRQRLVKLISHRR